MTSMAEIKLAMDEIRNVVIVGLMGAGKTTVGKALAKRLGWRFFDSDHEIERKTGVSVATVFEIEGEAGFRRREAETLAELCKSERIVLATGGGAVLSAENRTCLSEAGFVVYLKASPQQLYERTRHDRNRPLLQVADPLARLESLYTERAPLYEEVADFVIDSSRCNAHSAVQMLLKEVEKRCSL